MKFDKDEKEILESVENDEWRSIENLDEELKLSRSIAQATSTKDERMNIRMSRRDMMALKARALEQGIPYQTLVSNILRQWLRRAAEGTQMTMRLESLFSEQELEQLAAMLKKYLSRPRPKGVLMVREDSGGFVARPHHRDALLDQITSGDPTLLAEVLLTGANAALLFGRLNPIQGKPELTDDERKLLEKALDRISSVVPPFRV